jgi:hypothetical protein
MWKANGKNTALSLFLDSLFPETEIPCMRNAWRQERMLWIALSGGIVSEEALDLSSDRLLMMIRRFII